MSRGQAVTHAPSPPDPGRGERDVGIAQPWNSRQSKRISETFQSVECGDEELADRSGRGNAGRDVKHLVMVDMLGGGGAGRILGVGMTDRSIGAGHMRHGNRTQPRGRGGPHEQDPKTQKDVTHSTWWGNAAEATLEVEMETPRRRGQGGRDVGAWRIADNPVDAAEGGRGPAGTSHDPGGENAADRAEATLARDSRV
ncbi:hypothetical protein JB92DRAFT_2835061 [Gautieria morchelliformis]|nr:hypothetical protein JB92DRAFT_2835061 [Gautieria morchelliformis]